jgi:PAS domain S-box-containing protein
MTSVWTMFRQSAETSLYCCWTEEICSVSQRSKLATIILTAAGVMVASLMTILIMGIATTKANRELLHNRIVIDQLQETLSSLKDAETGQRGYLLTGDERYLQPYNETIARIQRDLLSLASMANAGDLPERNVNEVTDLTAQKLNELKQTIALRHSQQAQSALAIVQSDFGKHVMDAIRSQIGQMTATEESSLASAHRKVDAFVISSRIIIGLSTLLNLIVLAWAYRRIKDESLARETALVELRNQKELVEVTLSSIGDAVIVTDNNARITFLNRIAEQLTGWMSAQALTEPCTKVFRIINETSRQLVESPVDKVLRLGTIMGLANHTLLVRKDGTEVPIDDSGSPIRDANGTTRGVVLVFRDFSQHKAAENKLIEANRALESASRAKDQFLAALSHELRTPLTPVLATLTTWEASDELPASFLADVQMLRRNVELEARLIDDLLDLNRIIKGKLTLNLELVDAHELVEAVVTMLRSEINAKQLHVSMKLDATRHYVKGDPARLQQVFGNILNNAVKFTDRSGHVAIASGDDSEGRINLIFKDDGIGMSPEILGRLFQPFEQGADVTNRYGGLGLGMAISKALVDIHAGVLTAASDGHGHGAAFTVTLPSIQASTMKLPMMTGAAGANRRNTEGVSILLVEDHEDSAEVMSRLLRSKGYLVEKCATVAEAEKFMRDRQFNLLLSDIGLPDGTGIDLIREVRRHSTVPAIALTGFGMDQDISRYKEAGFDAHLTKPVNFQKLEMIINQFFSDNGSS